MGRGNSERSRKRKLDKRAENPPKRQYRQRASENQRSRSTSDRANLNDNESNSAVSQRFLSREVANVAVALPRMGMQNRVNENLDMAENMVVLAEVHQG